MDKGQGFCHRSYPRGIVVGEVKEKQERAHDENTYFMFCGAGSLNGNFGNGGRF